MNSQYEKNKIINSKFVGIGAPMEKDKIFQNIDVNLGICHTIFRQLDTQMPSVLVENNNHLGTSAYDVVTNAEFINEVVLNYNVALLLDIAHAKITAINTRVDEDDYFNLLPLSRVTQVHLSKHAVIDNLAYDAHEMLSGDDWDCFWRLRQKMPGLEFITLEYYQNAANLLSMTSDLKKQISMFG